MTGRRGFSLVELVISIGSATVLMAGLTACIIISTAAMRPSGVAFEKAELADIQRQITNDLQLATRFTERTATAVTFQVPDRDGDGNEETIRYAWAGTSGDPLTYALNGSTAINLVEGVQSFQFDFVTRSILGNGSESMMTTPVSVEVAFESLAEFRQVAKTQSATIDTPADTAEGDLLIAAITTKADTTTEHTAPAGWNFLAEGHEAGDVTLVIWWKLAEAGEAGTHTFEWGSDRETYSYIMRFSGASSSQPITSYAMSNGKSTTPPAPATTASADDSLILRLIGVKDDDINIDDAGVFDHTTITMKRNNDPIGNCSAGAAYRLQTDAGSVNSANFTLTNESAYATATIVIQPEDSP